MMNKVHPRLIGYLALLLVIVLAGCSSRSVEETTSEHRRKARELADRQQYHDALLEYRNAAILDPRDDEAQYQIALMHLKLGKEEDLNLAHHALHNVVKLNPSRFDAQLELARLYLIAGQSARALLYADGALSLKPENPDGHVIKGLSLIHEDRFLEGIGELEKAVETDPTRIECYLELARAHARRYDYGAAETVLRSSLRVNSGSIEARLALGDVLEAAGKVSEAETEYRSGLNASPSSGPFYFRLAVLEQKRRRPADAEAMFKRWIEAQPDDARAHVAFGQFHESIGRMEDALSCYQRAEAADRSSDLARKALLRLYIESHRLKEAARGIDTLLREHPADIEGRLLLGRLRFEEGDHQGALSLLQELARQQPRSAIVHQYLGLVSARMHKPTDARSALQEAKRLAPDSTDVRTSLAQLYLAEGEFHAAIYEADESLRLNPLNLSALRVVGEAYVRVGNIRKARQFYEEMAALLPDDPLVQFRLGVIFRLLHRDADALSHFERALAGSPPMIEALEHITAIQVSKGHLKKARDRVAQQTVASPDDPRVHNLMGQLWAVSRDFAQAETAFRKAMSLDDRVLATYANLGNLYERQGRTDEVIREFEAVVERHPKHVTALMILGILYERRGDIARATDRYERALAVDSGFAPAANNLAWLLIEHGTDRDRALSYAETARRVWPRDPHIADTLGWVYYHKQMYDKSVRLLKEAVEELPEQALIQYHYGMAQFANNNAGEAKKSLAKFLALSPADKRAREVKAVLSSLS